MNETVTYLGRKYTLAKDLGSTVVLCNDVAEDGMLTGGYMTVPVGMVKRED